MATVTWNVDLALKMSNPLNLWSHQGFFRFNALSTIIFWWSLRAIVYITLCLCKAFWLLKGLLQVSFYYICSTQQPCKVWGLGINKSFSTLNEQPNQLQSFNFCSVGSPTESPTLWDICTRCLFQAWFSSLLANLCALLLPGPYDLVHLSLTLGICPFNQLAVTIINILLKCSVYFPYSGICYTCLPL